MHWLNIEIIRTQGPEYTSAEPAQQLAWFHLLLYCAQQENGGIIREAATFTDRQWMRLIDVEGATLRTECLLWTWAQDGSLIVWEYPAKQEQVVQAKREGGRRGGDAKAQNRSTPSSTPSRTPTSTPSRTPSTKEELEEEEKEKEEISLSLSSSAAPIPENEGGSVFPIDPPPQPKQERTGRLTVMEHQIMSPVAPDVKAKRKAAFGPDPEACAVTLPAGTDPELLAKWENWQQYRQALASEPRKSDRKAWTKLAAEMSRDQIQKYVASHGTRIVCDRIATAISAGWQGLNLDSIKTQAYHSNPQSNRTATLADGTVVKNVRSQFSKSR